MSSMASGSPRMRICLFTQIHMKKPNVFAVLFFLFSVIAFGFTMEHMGRVSRAGLVSAATGVDVVVTATDNKASTTPGQMNTYTIVVTNVGSLKADSAFVYDYLPAAYDPTTSILSCSSCYYTEGNGTAEPYAEMTLAPGESMIVTIAAKLKLSASGSVSNTIQSGAWPAGTDVNAANNNATDTTSIVIATPTPSPTPTTTIVPSPTSSPIPTATPFPSSTPSSTPTTIPTASVTPSTTPIPTASPTPLPSATPSPQPATPERGIWFYDRTLPIGQSKIDTTLAQAKLYGFNAVYYTIEDYPALLARNDQVKIGQMRDALRKLAVQAGAKGIRVDALAGMSNWGEQAGFRDALATADFIIEYNRTAQPSERVGSLQFDVEPHTLSKYERNKAAILTRYVNMLGSVAQRIANSGVTLGFDVVVPDFFDSVQNWTPKITYNGKTQYTYNHILDLLQQLPQSKVIIMDYYNTTDGANGSIEKARPEIEQATSAQSKTKIVIALETGNFPPVDIISYYGMCRSKLEGDLSTLQTRFKGEASFGGFSIDSYDPYMAMKGC